MIVSTPFLIIYLFFAYKLTTWLLSWYLKKGSEQWKVRIQEFVTQHDGNIIDESGGDTDDDDDPNQRKVLFIVVPSSGAGKAMNIYEECLEELKNRSKKDGFTIETYVTKSVEDVKTLLERRRRANSETKDDDDDITKYYGILLLSGDSSITELIQEPLRVNDDKWIYPPLLHLPGGSTNLLTKELHSGKSYIDVLREFTKDKVKNGGLIKLSSPPDSKKVKDDDDKKNEEGILKPPPTSEPIYATHIAFHGMGRHMLNKMDQHRHSSYAVFGGFALLGIMLSTLYNPPNRTEIPYFALMIASTANFMGGNDSGFGMDLFDEELLMVHQIEYKGMWHYLQILMFKMGTGTLAKQYFENRALIPKELQVQIGSDFTFENHSFHFIVDGTTTVDFQATSVCINNLPGTLPYFVL